jgi:hypothetical protein
MAPSPENTIAITCGPPTTIKFALISFEELGFTPERTYATLDKPKKARVHSSGRENRRSDLGPPHPAHCASYQLIGRPHWGQSQRSSSYLIHS